MVVDVSELDVGDLLIVKKCQECGGSGEVENPWFEACRYDDLYENCRMCEVRDWCNKGEYVECYVCNGTGKVIVKFGGRDAVSCL